MVDIQVLSKILTREAKKAPRVPPSLSTADRCIRSMYTQRGPKLSCRAPASLSHLPPPPISRSCKRGPAERASLRGTPLYMVTPPPLIPAGAHLGSNSHLAPPQQHLEGADGANTSSPACQRLARRARAEEPCIFHAPNGAGLQKKLHRGFQGKEKRSTRHESPSHAH